MVSQMMIERTVRILKKDSAFLYAVLESLEGMAAYTTVAEAPGTCDVQLLIPQGFESEMNDVIQSLGNKMPIEVVARV